MSELRAPLREGLEDPFDEDEAAELGARIAARRDSSIRAPRRSPILPMAAIAAAAAVAVFVWTGREDPADQTPTISVSEPAGGPLRLTDGSLPNVLVTPEEKPSQDFAFDDGSSIRASSDTALDTMVNDAKRVDFALARGEVLVRVKPNGPRTWRIHTKLADIEVIGTEFTVREDPGVVEVAVHRGRVAVISKYIAEGRSVLESGQSLTIEESEEAAPVEPKTKPSAKPWRKLAQEQKFDQAYKKLGAEGVARETERARTVVELFDLADVARLSGHPEDAVEPLAHLVHRFPHDKRAGVAAFTLGRIEMTKLKNPKKAAEYFEKAIQLGVPPSLKQSAYVRAIETHMAAGQKKRAQSLVRAYLTRFPNGHHATQVEAWGNELAD